MKDVKNTERQISKRIGDYLKASRERAGLSIDDAAKLVPVAHVRELAKFESGLADPPMTDFVKILQCYEVSLREVRKFIGDLRLAA